MDRREGGEGAVGEGQEEAGAEERVEGKLGVRIRSIAKYAAVLLAGIVIGYWLAGEVAFDGCLDRGGVWNSTYSMCDAK